MTDIPTWKQKLEQQYINLAFDPAAALSDLSKKEASYLKKKKDEVTIRPASLKPCNTYFLRSQHPYT